MRVHYYAFLIDEFLLNLCLLYRDNWVLTFARIILDMHKHVYTLTWLQLKEYDTITIKDGSYV